MNTENKRADHKSAIYMGKYVDFALVLGLRCVSSLKASHTRYPLQSGGECQIPQIPSRGFGGFDIDLRERCRNDYSVNNSSDG
jgi:hypothetical protein